MKLSFPNPSRSFDETKSRVCFWGYDSTIEVSFFMERDALKRLCPDVSNVEEGILQAFDSKRQNIYDVADKVYRKSDKGVFSFILVANDF